MKVIKLNLIAFSLFALVLVFSRFLESRLLNYLYSFSVLFVSLVLGGINIAVLFQCLFKKTFNRLEFINVASASGLLVIPALYYLEISFLEKDYFFLPVLNALLLFVAYLVFCVNSKKSDTREAEETDYRNIKQSSIIFGVIAACFFLVVILISTSYFPLLEQDPYHWMKIYSESFTDGKLAPLVDRPLFLVLTRIFINTARIDPYAYFKYVFPLLSCLILLPVWSVAARFRNKLQQLAVLAIPLACSSTILYFLTPIPQTIAIIATYYFIFWLVYSRSSGNRYFYYLAGAAILLASFYHEMAVIIFLIWMLVTIIADKRRIYNLIISNKITVLLLAIIIIPYLSFVKSLPMFVIYWLEKIYNSILLFQTNWLFPAFYVNVDQNQMGWPGVLGVSKYYLFYVGPPLIFTAGVFCWLFVFRKSFRRYVFGMCRGRAETVVIGLSLLAFVLISDVLPRMVNVALLPERAWIFGGIFLSVITIGILRYFNEKNIYYPLLIGIFTIVSIGAAIQINSLKKYVVPNYQLQSAEWIRSNLPSNRIILSVGNVELLGFHTNSVMYNMPANFFCNEEFIQPKNFWKMFESINPVTVYQKNLARRILNGVENYLGQADTIDEEKLRGIISDEINISKSGISDLNKNKNVYIFYFVDDPRNPYAHRPYRKLLQRCTPLIFDRNSDVYERIYSDQDKVIIWHAKQ